MTDPQLLEAAARAAGWRFLWFGANFHVETAPKSNLWTPWNPLKDDADAFRLLAEFGGSLRFSSPPTHWVSVEMVRRYVSSALEQIRGDAASAARRAIVAAAAGLNVAEREDALDRLAIGLDYAPAPAGAPDQEPT
ncbi:MAG: hypothetical protein ACK5XA_08405 [Tagaea sp.]